MEEEGSEQEEEQQEAADDIVPVNFDDVALGDEARCETLKNHLVAARNVLEIQSKQFQKLSFAEQVNASKQDNWNTLQLWKSACESKSPTISPNFITIAQ